MSSSVEVKLECVTMFVSIPLLLPILLVGNTRCDNVFNNRFTDIRFSRTFIDKTLLLYEVFNFSHLSLNAPYKFGKSSNIGMLNLFFSNLRTKETITEYFNGTQIWKDESFVDKHMGDHPVILFNTSFCGVVYDEDHMICTFQWVMRNTFLDHSYLVHSKNIFTEDKEKLKEYLDVKRSQCIKFEGLKKGLLFLAKLLYQHFAKPVLLLVDGFSGGVMERLIEDNTDLRYLNSIVLEYYNSIYNFTLLNQEFISHTVVSSETWLYGMNEPVKSLFNNFNFMENQRLSYFFGFTYDELEYLLCRFDIPFNLRPQVLKWYCGYTSLSGEVKVCNPYSVLQYLNSPYKIIKVYWFGSPIGPDLLQRMVESTAYQKHIQILILNQPINVSVEAHYNSETVDRLRRTVEELQPESQGFIFQVLKDTGFLTYASPQNSGTKSLKFPNEEIRSVVDKFVSLLSFI